MAPTAADVPTKYDCLINGQGYVYYDPWTVGSSSNAPEKAVFTYTPTFIDRQNTQGDYGDNQQDFWLTYSQKDWSLGEQQRFQGRTDEGKRKYWTGSKIDVRKPGRVSLRRDTVSVSVGSSVRAVVPNGTESVRAAGTTNVFTITSDGTVTDVGAHGLGAAPAKLGMSVDTDIYLSTTAGGTVGVRKLEAGVFSTFSATASDSLAHLNNTLYGFVNSTGILQQYSTAGVASTVFQWKGSDGGARAFTSAYILPFGGKLLIVFKGFQIPSLWIYDGTGVSALTDLPPDFFPVDAAVSNGIIFVSGAFQTKDASTNAIFRPAVLYYAQGTQGLLWASEDTYTGNTSAAQDQSGPSVVTAYDRGIVFTDDVAGKLMFYDVSTGGIHSMASYTVASDNPRLAACNTFVFHTRNQTTAYLHPHNTNTASSGSVTHSLIDFDSSLSKIFRGIKVDFDSASDGDGGSIDIAYRVGDVDGSYTTLQTGAVSGTEYTLSSITGRSISVKITLNKGTSTSGPVLKRVSVRAVPVAPAFRLEQYILNCTGRAETGINDPKYVELRDGTSHNLDGLQMATNLKTAYTLGTTMTIVDELGSYTGVIDQLKLTRIRPCEYVAEVTVREV